MSVIHNFPADGKYVFHIQPQPAVEGEVFGRTFPNPIGLAAGYDKDALAWRGLGCLGFGHIEVGTVTPRPQPGNPRPRVFRLAEERSLINSSVVEEVDKASDAWGVKILRYEIKNITPPDDVLSAMEKQMRAEREKRAVVLTSEGERDARINEAEGSKQQVIKQSEAVKQQRINEAEGEAEAIKAVARATAEGLRQIADALQTQGGTDAMQLRIAEQYITEFGKLAKEGNTFVVPASLGDIGGMIALAKGMLANGESGTQTRSG